jgi:hypothetical protein
MMAGIVAKQRWRIRPCEAGVWERSARDANERDEIYAAVAGAVWGIT